MLNGGDGALAGKRPDPFQDRLESNAMFVDGPQLNGRLWQRCGPPAPQGAPALLEVRLGLWVGAGMARARHTPTGATAPPGNPAPPPTHPPLAVGHCPFPHRP